MSFKKFKNIGNNLGLTSMLCAFLKGKILLYGGSNFPDGTPPFGLRKVYNDIYLYDENFELILSKKGKIFPDRGITITTEEYIYYVSGAGNTKIFRYSFKNDDIFEEEIFDIGLEIIGGFGCYYKNKLYFGKDFIYEFDLESNKLIKKSNFISEVREQSVFFEKDGFLYVLSGASNICYLDSYKYDIENDKWHKLKDVPTNFTGASSVLIEDKVLIVGGCNKEIYDEAVLNLSNIDFKKQYFSKQREDFSWNKTLYVYNIKDDSYEIVEGGSIENATCGSTLLKLKDKLYLINGEVKPGYRTPLVYEGDIL